MRTGAAPGAQTPRAFELKNVIEIADVGLWPISDGPLDAANGWNRCASSQQDALWAILPASKIKQEQRLPVCAALTP
jgi:hypothetical protein